jgi:hypothetical protein
MRMTVPTRVRVVANAPILVVLGALAAVTASTGDLVVVAAYLISFVLGALHFGLLVHPRMEASARTSRSLGSFLALRVGLGFAPALIPVITYLAISHPFDVSHAIHAVAIAIYWEGGCMIGMSAMLSRQQSS